MSKYAFGVVIEDETFSFNFEAEDNKDAYSTCADIVATYAVKGGDWSLADWKSKFEWAFGDVTIHSDHVGDSDHTFHVFDPNTFRIGLHRDEEKDPFVTFDAHAWGRKYDINI